MSTVTLKPAKEKRVFSKHPWIFRSDIDHADASAVPGNIVSVLSSKGRFLAKAIYNPNSQIALRIMSYQDEPINRDFIFRRVHEAIEYRRTFADLKSCRLIFAEIDRLPAVITDAFSDVLVLQSLALGMEQFKKDIIDALVAELHPRGIWERNDVPVRRLEGLERTLSKYLRMACISMLMLKKDRKPVFFWIRKKTGLPLLLSSETKKFWIVLPIPVPLLCMRGITVLLM